MTTSNHLYSRFRNLLDRHFREINFNNATSLIPMNIHVNINSQLEMYIMGTIMVKSMNIDGNHTSQYVCLLRCFICLFMYLVQFKLDLYYQLLPFTVILFVYHHLTPAVLQQGWGLDALNTTNFVKSKFDLFNRRNLPV